MQDDTWQAFSERVSCEDSWHVDSEPLVLPMPDAMAQAMADRNMATLTTIAALSERHADLAEDDSPVMQELQRMDAKLSALVDIVNHLLTPLSELPARQLLRFNVIGAVLPAALVPAGHSSLLLRLRFDVCRSLPLELAAKVERQLDDGRVFVVFVQQGDALGDAIERLVFRHHRRKVAEARQLTV